MIRVYAANRDLDCSSFTLPLLPDRLPRSINVDSMHIDPYPYNSTVSTMHYVQ